MVNMTTQNTIRSIFENYRTIAVYGMSSDGKEPSQRIPSYLASKGYRIIPINLHADRIAGWETYRRLRDVREHVDILQVFRPSDEALSVVKEAMDRKMKKGDIHVIWLQLGIENEDARKLAEESGILFIQNKCMYEEHRRIYKGESKT